jgi:hypothetical protein
MHSINLFELLIYSHAAQIVTFFENYLESKYQFPKLDSAAIPQFAAGV